MRRAIVATAVLLMFTSGILSAAPGITFTTSANPSPYGSPLTLTATVSDAAATGRVTFFDGAGILGSAPVTAGKAIFTTTTLNAGPHALKAFYSGATATLVETIGVTPTPSNGFRTLLSNTISGTPQAIAVADFNGDSIPDIATVTISSQSEGTLGVLLGAPGGVFRPGLSFPVRSLTNLTAIAVADFNGDGKLDLVLTGGVTLLLGNGDGTFQPQIDLIPGGHAAIAVADLNADGFPDIVVTDGAFVRSVSILLGNGDGTFQPVTTYPTGLGPLALTIADFNNDGVPDLAIANQFDDGVSILLGNGDGTFRDMLRAPAGLGPIAIVACDFDADGNTDLAVSNQRDNTITILLGNGDGTFRQLTQYVYGLGALALVLGDFNADGIPDLATVFNSGDVSVFSGLGDGHFQVLSRASTGITLKGIALADFNADGRPDFAVIDGVRLSVLVGTNLTPSTLTLIPSQNPSPYLQPLTLTARVEPSGASGTVFFFNGKNQLGGIALNNGSASLSVNSQAGAYEFSAVYAGDAIFAASATSYVQQITGSPVTMTLSSSANPSLPGEITALTAVLNPPTVTGVVSFFNGRTLINTAQLIGAQAVLLTSFPAPGDYTLTATYAGGGNFSAADSQPLIQTVVASRATSTVTLAAPTSPATLGSPVQLSASVSPSTATGNVAFYDGPTFLGIATLNAGQAIFTTSLLPFGPRSLRAVYSGDKALAPSTSAIVQKSITAVPGNGFQASATYPVGDTPKSIAVADLNRDGLLDLIVSNSGEMTVSVLLANTAGTYRKSVSYPLGTFPAAVVVGDFNADGIPDIVTANTNSTVSILIGKGDGTFQAPFVQFIGNVPVFLAVFDYDGDGRPDLMAGSAVLLGIGDGTFQRAVNISPTDIPYAIALADFNGDGNPDFAFALLNGTIRVQLNTGKGTYTPVTMPAPTSNASAMVATDVNGDGKPDIVYTTFGGIGTLLGKGDGTFRTGAVTTTAPNPLALAVGDFDGDNLPDLVVAHSGGTASQLFGKSSLLSAITINAGIAPRALLVADLNGDGRADLAVANSSGVAVLLGRSAKPTQIALTASANPSPYGQNLTLTAAVSPASATGRVLFLDGAILLGTATLAGGQATLTTGLLTAGAHTLSATYAGDALNVGATSAPVAQVVGAPLAPGNALQPAVNYSAGINPQSVVVADFNGDGVADIAVANYGSVVGSGTVSLSLGNGDGTFHNAVNYPAGSGSIAIATADFNRDGKLDLVVANYASDNVSILLGNGDGTFQTPLFFPAKKTPIAVAVADFDADGIPDLVIGNYNAPDGGVIVLLGNGDGTFRAPLKNIPLSTLRAVTTADLNNDGVPDVVACGLFAVYGLLGNGDGTLGTPFILVRGTIPYTAVIADFNRDGKPDIATAEYSIGRINVSLGSGSAVFQAPVFYSSGTNTRSLVSGDFDGDGIIDLAAINFGPSSIPNGSLSVFLGNGDGTFQPAVTYPTGTNPTALAAGDFNNDGRTDLVVTNQSNTFSIHTGALATAPAITLTSTPNPSRLTQRVTLTASIPETSGVVTFLDGKTVLGANAVIGGRASLTVPFSLTGEHLLQARFVPSGGYLSSVSQAISHTVSGVLAIPSLTLTSSANPSTFGAPLVITAAIGPADATGTVTFYDDVNLFGSSVVTARQALLTISQLPAGTRSLRAYYSGDANYAFTTSTPLFQTVRSNPAADFRPALSLATGRAPLAIATADFNRDGRADLAVVNSGDNTVSIFLSNPDGGFQAAVNLTTGSTPSAIATVDFNLDGSPDLAVANSGDHTVGILLGNPDGTFQPGGNFPTGLGPSAILTADFNLDGIPDLAVLNQLSSDARVFLGNGDGTFQSPRFYLLPAGHTTFAVTNFNSVVDSKPDLLVAVNGLNGVYALVGIGDGTFTISSFQALGPSTGPLAITTGGIQGFAVADYEGPVLVRPVDSRGAFGPQTAYTAGLHPWAITAADTDGDNIADLLVVNNGDNTVSLLHNRGDSTFAPPTNYPTGASPVALLTADFNGDGKTDIAVVNYGENTVTILTGN